MLERPALQSGAQSRHLKAKLSCLEEFSPEVLWVKVSLRYGGRGEGTWGGEGGQSRGREKAVSGDFLSSVLTADRADEENEEGHGPLLPITSPADLHSQHAAAYASIFFSNANGAFTKIDCLLSHKTTFNTFKRIQTVPNVLS